MKETYHQIVTGWDSLAVLEEDNDCYESLSTDSYDSVDEDM